MSTKATRARNKPEGTFYHVDSGRSRAVLENGIGPEFPGVLVSDCLSVYDLDYGEQQKCYAHHLKAISSAMKLHPEQGQGFLADIKLLLQDALAGSRAPEGLLAPVAPLNQSTVLPFTL